MKYYLRLLKYIRPYIHLAILGLILMGFYALVSGFSLTMLYPIFEKVFAGSTDVATTGVESSVFEQTKGLIFRTFANLGSLYDKGGFAEIGGFFKSGFDEIMKVNSPMDVLEFICVAALILIFLKTGSDYGQKAVFVGLEQRVVMNLRNDLFQSLQKQSLDFHHKFKSGELVTRLISDVNAVRIFTISNIAELLKNIMQIIVFVTMTFIISWKLALIAYVVVSPIMLLVGRLGHKLRTYSGRAQAAVSDTLSFLSEKIPAARVVIAFGQGNYEVDQFKKVTQKFYRRFVKMMKLDILAAPLSELFGTIIGVAVLYYGASQVLSPDSSLSTGLFMVFLAALFSMMHPLTRTVKVYADIKKGSALMARIFEVQDYPPTIIEAEDPLEIDTVAEGIKYEDVSFSYDGKHNVLNNINLEIPSGKTVALVGPSGAGKSTMADLIPRFYDPAKGRVTIDNTDIKKLSLYSLRSLLGIVTQETILFNTTVAGNIAYGKPEATEKDIRHAAELANALNFIEEMSKGFETVLGERGTRLSGGQRQRIAIARAILCNPEILILDEATSSLDNESERAVQGAIANLLKNRTTMVIAHRLSTIIRADKIAVLDKGAIIDTGTHDELISRCPLYQRLYELEFTSKEDVYSKRENV
ncbi:MAG: ATP-binding cassette domain-containing protein [candidate division Zixibacteria bacterium]|nr:ATP-binding cassette domain-containing protein [candidate division Zixibacteria bacterium]